MFKVDLFVVVMVVLVNVSFFLLQRSNTVFDKCTLKSSLARQVSSSFRLVIKHRIETIYVVIEVVDLSSAKMSQMD